MSLVVISDGIIAYSLGLAQHGDGYHYPQARTLGEFFNNHEGTTENFLATATSGNATAAADAANHEMDLSSGITLAGVGSYGSKKTWALSSSMMVFNGIISAFNIAAVSTGVMRAGFKTNFTADTNANQAVFRMNSDGTWVCITSNATLSTQTAITTPTAGDVLSVILTSSYARFYVNGAAVATHTTRLPVNVVGIGVHVTAGAGDSGAVTASVDVLDFARWL